VNNITSTASDEVASAIITAYYSPSEGDAQDYDGKTYTYTAGAWVYNNEVTATASDEVAAAIVAEYYTAKAGDTQEIDDVTYVYDGSNWSYVSNVTVTAYYQFSASDSSLNSPVIIQEAVTDGETENTSVPSPAFIGGTGKDFVVDGVGTVSGLDDGEYVVVNADGDTAALIAVNGDMNFMANDKNVAMTLNDAELNYTTAEKGAVVELAAQSAAAVLADPEGAVTLKSIDDKQSWLLNDTAENALTFDKASYHAEGVVYVTSVDSLGSILSAELDEAERLVVSKNASGGSDKVRVNAATIEAAANANATIEAADDYLALTVGSSSATVAVNGDNANLAAGAAATIEGSGSDANITAVSALASNGKLITDNDAITVNEEVWSFSDTGDTYC